MQRAGGRREGEREREREGGREGEREGVGERERKGGREREGGGGRKGEREREGLNNQMLSEQGIVIHASFVVRKQCRKLVHMCSHGEYREQLLHYCRRTCTL